MAMGSAAQETTKRTGAPTAEDRARLAAMAAGGAAPSFQDRARLALMAMGMH